MDQFINGSTSKYKNFKRDPILKMDPIFKMDRFQNRPISKWTNFKMDRLQNGPTPKLIENWSPTRTPSSTWTILKIGRFQNEHQCIRAARDLRERRQGLLVGAGCMAYSL